MHICEYKNCRFFLVLNEKCHTYNTYYTYIYTKDITHTRIHNYLDTYQLVFVILCNTMLFYLMKEKRNGKRTLEWRL